MSRGRATASRGPHAVGLFAFACLVAPAGAFAQADEDELALPPRIDTVPSQARLADPPEDRVDMIEEVIVTNDNPWRLPDLGSTWRARQTHAEELGRIRANFMPLYDPDDPAASLAPLFPANREMQRVGFIQLFRVRFGGRDTD